MASGQEATHRRAVGEHHGVQVQFQRAADSFIGELVQRPVAEAASAAAGHVVKRVKSAEAFPGQRDRGGRVGGIGGIARERRYVRAELLRGRGQGCGVSSGDYHAGPGGETRAGARQAESGAAADDDDDAIGEGGEGHRANELTGAAVSATVNPVSEKDPRWA